MKSYENIKYPKRLEPASGCFEEATYSLLVAMKLIHQSRSLITETKDIEEVFLIFHSHQERISKGKSKQVLIT